MTENPTAAAHLRHQLRTPLNHIIGYTEMLLEDAEGTRPELVADLRGIHSAAHRLLVLVNEYLESPKGQTGAADPVGLTAPFTAAIDLIIASAERVTKHAGGTALRSDLAKICSAAEQLLGVMMPEMDGVEVLRRLKSHAEWRDLPVLMISALDEIDSVVRCIELGAEDYLAKPFDSVLLRARIGACLEKKRFRDQEARHLEALAEWNRRLEERVQAEVAKVERLGRLKRFVSPQLAEAAEPEELMAVLHEYHATIGELILEYEGTLERFTGDGMMIFFNDPVPVENPAEKAVRMAVAMRERVAELVTAWRKRGFGLDLGIGIAHGFATIGAIGFEGRMDYTAIGTVTNLAARLCGEAKAGQILVSQRVAGAVEDTADVEPIGEIALKGFQRPVKAFSILGLKS